MNRFLKRTYERATSHSGSVLIEQLLIQRSLIVWFMVRMLGFQIQIVMITWSMV